MGSEQEQWCAPHQPSGGEAALMKATDTEEKWDIWKQL